MKNEDQHNLSKSAMIEEIPLACSDELAAVELLAARGGNGLFRHAEESLV